MSVVKGLETERSWFSGKPEDRSRAGSIPRRVRAAAILIFLMVALLVALALQAIHSLSSSSDVLLDTALPVQRQLLEIRDTQGQAEFYRRLAGVLPHSGYEHTFHALVQREQQELQALLPIVQKKHPELGSRVLALSRALTEYGRAAIQANGADVGQRGVDAALAELHGSLQKLFLKESQQAAEARTRAVWLLYLLVAVTAALALWIPWRVAVALTRPLGEIRRALEDLGAGRATRLIREGPQEIRDLAASIETMQSRLREEERLRHVFLSQVSHELKTPLASARSGAELMLSERLGKLSQAQREVLEIISRQVQELYVAIQEMLDMHALQAQSLEYSLTDLPLSAQLQELRGRMQPLLDRRQQTLEIAVDEGLQVRADPKRLLQILSNLVSNAHKYSVAGDTIRVAAQAEGGGVRIQVRDHGPGIPEALLGRVFERFFQVSASSNLPRGTGLGLAIARELVLAQHGEIRVRNHPQGGLSAEVWLPCPPPRESRP
ncbi:HAMP domain-containing sensor histidine kinase [Acidithiobacillus sp.]|uniref:sensor histidine kinase n=1 Tax=Acidithiobacillus sp. TaxID=1872118 RepID=UPI0025B8EE86|nr:HAMP domain-containing sensor histidine kinase [Acidithiobacillus sp.]